MNRIRRRFLSRSFRSSSSTRPLSLPLSSSASTVTSLPALPHPTTFLKSSCIIFGEVEGEILEAVICLWLDAVVMSEGRCLLFAVNVLEDLESASRFSLGTCFTSIRSSKESVFMFGVGCGGAGRSSCVSRCFCLSRRESCAATLALRSSSSCINELLKSSIKKSSANREMLLRVSPTTSERLRCL